jgi:hypothetical protein
MYSDIIRAIPFNRISQVLTPGITTLPYPILRDISETYINTIPTPTIEHTSHQINQSNQTNQIITQNTKPLITSYLSFRELFERSKSIPEYPPLHNQVDSILVQGYFRDIATCSIPEKQMVIMRVWFDYDKKTRLIKFINVYELCNDIEWCVDTQRYFKLIKEPLLVPSFDEIANDNDGFIKKLQVMV